MQAAAGEVLALVYNCIIWAKHNRLRRSKWCLDRFFQPAMAIFSKSNPERYDFFRGYELVVLGSSSRRSANMSKSYMFEPIAKYEKGGFKVGL